MSFIQNNVYSWSGDTFLIFYVSNMQTYSLLKLHFSLIIVLDLYFSYIFDQV